MLIKLSQYSYIKFDRINRATVYQQEDSCWYVKWFTEDGEIISDAHTGKIAACNYIEDIADEIINHQREFIGGTDDNTQVD